MDAILPSEVARLILGYLEDENCPEVATMFLEQSPLLRECYSIAQRGGKFPRRLQGISLMNILDKFCAINALVQERLGKLEDCEGLKGSGDILEQLRFLMDGSKGQRFVVNINVPTQNAQASGGSPIISSSMRKRRHSGPVDRDKLKKLHKSQTQLDGKSDAKIAPECDTVETTLLEQLPGHKNLNAPATGQEDDRRAQCSSTSTEAAPKDKNHMALSNCAGKSITCDPSKDALKPESLNHTCETGTDTNELRAFTNTEVQTAPCDGFETASDMMDGPVENLSLLTKELLNRTELQERIAQTINRAIIQSETSLRDASFTEVNAGECNTSIMRELDNAMKTIITETETDPIFERFLLETIGTGIEGETSPDEDGGNSPNVNGGESSVEASPEKAPKDKSLAKKTQVIETQAESKDLPPRGLPPPEKDLAALDDVNAEAILSIINVSNTSKELIQEKIPEPTPVLNPIPPTENHIDQVSMDEDDDGGSQVVNDNVVPQWESKNRRKRASKPKRERKRVSPKKIIPEHELEQVATLVVVSQAERQEELVNSMKIPIPRSKNQFVPIMPKSCDVVPKQVDNTLYLRAVNVVRSKVPDAVPSTSSTDIAPIQLPEPRIEHLSLPNVLEIVQQSDTPLNESITLYGTESGAEAVMNADIPSVQVDESMSLTGTGLSPFLKLHRKPTPNQDEKPLSTQSNTDLLTRRTPRSIMKSRSRNHRLSLSTPRRRSSHIRALDFNTPTKGLNSSRRMSDADKNSRHSSNSSNSLSKACRTSLFKSPPFASDPSPKKKMKTPAKLCKAKIPIATRSPAPKLIGGWDKITGVGMIIEGTSQSSCPSSPEKMSAVAATPASDCKKTWDSDLRMKVAADVQSVQPTLPKKKGRSVRKRASSRKEKSTAGEESMVISEDEGDGIKTTVDLIAAVKVRGLFSPIHEESLEISNKNASLEISNKNESLEISNKNDKVEVKSTVSAVAEIAKPIEMEVIKQVIESTNTSEIITTEQGVTKKYAKLKTLTTSVKKGKDNNRRVPPRTPGESLEKSGDFSRNDSFKLPDLETPRKFDANFVPPTPRVLSPNSNMTTPFAQVTEDPGKIKTFVSTPEFPPTPSINLTPKQSNDSTMDEKKAEFGSTYYQPSCEVKEVRTKARGGSGAGLLSSGEERVLTTTISSQGFQASTSQLEITQFEVIKENLPKEQAIKELKLSRSSDSQTTDDTTITEAESTVDTPNAIAKNLESSGTADDSSASDSDSSSSSSCSSSSSSSCDDTNTSSKLSTSRKSKKTPHKVDGSSNNDFTQESPAIAEKLESIAEVIKDDNEAEKTSPEISVEDALKENTDSQQHNEKSPLKVIPIVKTEAVLKLIAMDLETPAKDESLLAEADISETPSSSKAGIESLTNLNSKISAIIKEDSKTAGKKLSGPLIVSVEKLVSPTVKLRKMTDEELENVNRNYMDAKLARELDEKRLRMLSKLRSDTAPPKPKNSRSKERGKSKPTEPDPPKAEANSPKKQDNSQPRRKSQRNVEKKAKRGLSEPKENMTISDKIAPEQKAQSSRDASGNDDGNVENIIDPSSSPIIEDEPMIGEQGRESVSDDKHVENEPKEKEDLIVEDQNRKEMRGKVKSKVDMVKRDLFSDDENTDGKSAPQPTRPVDLKKSEGVEPVEAKPQSEESGEHPGVLESLELVPATKSFEEAESAAGGYEHIEISFVYDETQPPRKKLTRRRKLSNTELEMKVQVENDQGEIVWKTMTTTAFEELFKLTPGRKKPVRAPPKPKTTKEKPEKPEMKPMKPIIARRGKQVENSNNKAQGKAISDITRPPLATSSPVNNDLPPKADKIKAANSRSKGEDKKPRKRKPSESKDVQPEKKPRTIDPTALLEGLDIDKLLNKVHGSDS